MYQNENGEYVTARTVTDEDGDTYKEYHTYRENGWVRVNCFYEDGTVTEEYEKEV